MGDHKEQPLRVGAAVRRRRRALELTLSVVAERSGLSVPFLSQVENERARPSKPSLERIADALGTTAVELLAAADPACSVDVVRAADDGLTPSPQASAPLEQGSPPSRARSLVRGHHQLHAVEFTGDHDEGREVQHRNDELMYVVEGGVEVEAEGRAHRLGRGDTLYMSGGVRHRWRATVPDTRVIVVAVADHIEALEDRHRRGA
ncbi:XRE family transcriptional regulator [Streptomyces ipomoeae]|uniref:DNA-binding helix-turn-helix protein n=2 Tax=Streptomyces ipomoeae TaxID=103232 RepID=L1KR55_9ACTN|nr:helix-turn-helix domain-containing protein [Streptomyces ipomoeae]EKX62970.1 DNA-binding helix-turn-helix protein [Streptomyces ipomoeae 91-03]MDX2699561.1 helix-turn-helix domain-containing protein [Streptomyces ipomoeae]MDX2840867.1 helix-turn-helix domain-containing protein [Streptomyces ipomoeae]MDX2932179.1 helix-turn-helix domain-containing protein [Streptomyces ipomoeae]TQE15729.1 XRE family transcriptional regulator [Streptomyces ipomoeae]